MTVTRKPQRPQLFRRHQGPAPAAASDTVYLRKPMLSEQLAQLSRGIALVRCTHNLKTMPVIGKIELEDVERVVERAVGPKARLVAYRVEPFAKSRQFGIMGEHYELAVERERRAYMRRRYRKMRVSTGECNVICHGDLWRSNIMLRDEPSSSISCRLVDYQMLRYASPSCDVAMLLYVLGDPLALERWYFHDRLAVYRKAMDEDPAYEAQLRAYLLELFAEAESVL
ncbi:hypothetical protein TSAR_014330 [Trichomalopsis sarcophagae]|uniref:CHK kinase-like domain-containing protein n=1 Tax=Trichomalopsis sarcophagae TaxID=543379 RepID=A0A232EG73_9HYME|nr:hypothetical protein TSAR_014330 [Trichomalopsis sarcophagae]